MMDMTDKKIWFITGAARGMGVDIAKAALAAGHGVVATARNADAITTTLGEHDELFAVELDITDPDSVADAVSAAVARFGRVDVLVNNAGNFYAGYFENISPEQFRAQMETNFFGPLNVSRAVLPVMRKQRSGQVITITSAAGLIGQEFCSAYAASKFALEGWMESLRFEVEPFGIATMLWVFDATAPEFRSGWFVESLATQTLIVFVIRTRRVPFFRSRPSRPLLTSVIAVVIVGATIPQSPLNETLGFAPLPAAFFAVLVAFVIAYLTSVEVAKYFFYKTAVPTTVRPLQRGHTHRIHRLASRWSHHQSLPPVVRPGT